MKDSDEFVCIFIGVHLLCYRYVMAPLSVPHNRGRVNAYCHYLLFVACMLYACLCRDESYDILCVCDWNQKLSFYQLSGKQVSMRFGLASNTLYLCNMVHSTLKTSSPSLLVVPSEWK